MTDKSSIASEATGTPTAREFIATESWLTRISGSDRAKSALELNQTGNELYILKDCERAAFFFWSGDRERFFPDRSPLQPGPHALALVWTEKNR
jgi:hypothetical protein